MTACPSPGVPVWWLRTRAVDLVTLHAVASSERPDGTVVDVVSLPPGTVPQGPRVIRARMRPDSRQVLDVVVMGELAGNAPALVWHEQVRRDLRPVQVHLLAFSHEDVARLAAERMLGPVAPGTVLTAGDVRRLGLTSADQVAATRWNPATGEVAELYVDPGHRRRRIGTSLLAAAEACAVGREWPCLWGGGTRTALGESLRRGLPWGIRRMRPLEHLAPPMTPPAAADGRLAARAQPTH